MNGSGLSAAIQMAAQLELDFPGLEVLSFGRSATVDTDTVLEIGGAHLCYRVSLCGEKVILDVALMDGVQDPENILRSPDTQAGWDVLDRLIRSMETYGVQDLSRPIVVGDPLVNDPRSCWVIS